jgi:hypothetical protein
MIGPRVHGVGRARHGLLLSGEWWAGTFVHGYLEAPLMVPPINGWKARVVPTWGRTLLALLICFARKRKSDYPGGVSHQGRHRRGSHPGRFKP